MGDRVSVYLRLGGCLQSIEEAEELMEALALDTNLDTDAEMMALFKEAIANQEPIEAEAYEVDSGNLDNVESFVRDHKHLSCEVNFGRGGGFDAGSTVIHEGETHTFPDGNTIPRDAVIKALDEGGDQAVRDLIKRAHFLQHECVPPLTGSDEVRGWLSILG